MSFYSHAQVGINTPTPKTTMDVSAKRDTNGNITDNAQQLGLQAPRVTRAELTANTASYGADQRGSLIYVTDISAGNTSGQRANITTIGYYYFDGSSWQKITNGTPDNIYNANGTLTGSRTVTQGGNTLAFTGSAVNAFSVDGTTLSVDATNHRVGIGTTSPTLRLDVNANNAAIGFRSLATLPTGTSSRGLVVDGSGNVFQNNSVSVEGQIMRIPINGMTITATESPIILNDAANDAPNGSSNVINTVVNGQLGASTSITANNGAPTRTTRQIMLDAGVYKVEVRLVGVFAAESRDNTFFVKAIVNNREYSLSDFSTNSRINAGYLFSDYVIMNSRQPLDFTVQRGGSSNNFSVASSASPGVGNSLRSMVLVQRLR